MTISALDSLAFEAAQSGSTSLRAPASALRCTHLITDLELAGAEMMLYNLLTHMDASRFCNSVISLTRIGPIGQRLMQRGIPVQALGLSRTQMANPLCLWRLSRMLRASSTQILQTWMYHADLVGLLAGKLAGVPRIIWNVRRSTLEFPNRPWTRWIVSANAALSALPQTIVVNSEAGRAVHVRQGYRPEKFMVIPNGFDLNRFSPRPDLRSEVRAELGLPQDAFVIGMVANWRAIKGHAVFLQAASHFASRHPQARFVIVGAEIPGHPYGFGQAAEAAPHLNQTVTLLGMQENMPRLLQAFDVLSSCSYSEGFPNVVGEAMACGIACIVTDVGSSARLVGDTGRVIAPGDPAALDQAWEAMFELSAEERAQMSLAARHRMEKGYDILKVAQRYEHLYQRDGG
jgi:glycosyltransferase involved in cell wall biosynthesis